MNLSKKITVIGGDTRQKYVYKYLTEMGFKTFSYEISEYEELMEAVNASDIIIAPVSIEKYIDAEKLGTCLKPGLIFAGGNMSGKLINCCKEKNISYYDYMKSEDLYACNSVLTGEGVLCAIIENTPFAINGASALVIGYGRCGSVISSMLIKLGCSIWAVDKSSENCKRAETEGVTFCSRDIYDKSFQESLDEYDFIVNTVPDIVLDSECLSGIKPDCVLFDIASKPGFDNTAIENYGLKLIKLPGLPGRYSPKTAGELIAKDILQNLSLSN